MLTLRAHHLLCIQGYKGYGYSKNFTENMDKIICQLKKDTFTRIKVISGVDEICSCCPNNTEEKLCRYEIKIKSIDKKILNLLDLNLNEIYTYKYILDTIHEKINHKIFENICGTCQWFKYGYCQKGLGL
ncbi:DUF1284 domain-containing protein [Clostridium kluyveri]|uniref:DUF1284 domain-containing protein n=1 Tax=Clostridium kluyveri TaxID=1534 RepID=UPI002247B180|nr:DUF1284 domain-containing protein [Clostridium kluyveri]UZQ50374.1 DUF1284 domain-containing protein [Clostridium kluyveri]